MPSSNSPKNKISARIKPADTVILGLSGGPDSVYLLYHLLENNPPVKVVAGHVNYHLRGRDSELDQQFVEKLCRELEIPLEILEIHGLKDKKINSKGNLEEKCRDLRYEFLEKLRLQHKAKLIVIGHHLNDQLETFLLNLTRGSSLSGFRAMREYDDQRRIFRPLLDLPKAEILSWFEKTRHSFRLDKTNQSERFKRNLIRARVIPVLEKINPHFLITAGKSLRDLDGNLQVVEQLTGTWLEKHLTPVKTKASPAAGAVNGTTGKTVDLAFFGLNTFLLEPAIMQKNLLRLLYKNLHHGSITSGTIQEIIDTLHKNRAGLRKEFGPQTFLKIIKDDKTAKRLVVIERKFL